MLLKMMAIRQTSKQFLTRSKIVENHLSFASIPSKSCQNLLLQSLLKIWLFLKFSFLFYFFHNFAKKCWVLILILVKQIVFFVKFAVFWIFMKKVTELQIAFFNLEFSLNFVFSWNFAKFLLRFCWALDISSKLLILTFLEKLENFFQISEILVFQKSSSKITGLENNRHVEKSW